MGLAPAAGSKVREGPAPGRMADPRPFWRPRGLSVERGGSDGEPGGVGVLGGSGGAACAYLSALGARLGPREILGLYR